MNVAICSRDIEMLFCLLGRWKELFCNTDMIEVQACDPVCLAKNLLPCILIQIRSAQQSKRHMLHKNVKNPGWGRLLWEWLCVETLVMKADTVHKTTQVVITTYKPYTGCAACQKILKDTRCHDRGLRGTFELSFTAQSAVWCDFKKSVAVLSH